MKLPSPDDPAQAPVWENYVFAQATQASLAQIPPSTLAYGVRPQGTDVRLIFQLSALTEQDRADMDEIADAMESLVGEAVNVTVAHEVRQERDVRPGHEVRWIYLARVPHDYDHG